MALPKIASIHKADPDMHMGLPVLPLRVGDPLPQPPLATLYAVRVYPDLARYLLTLNHPDNRSLRTSKWHQYAGDMTMNRWRWNVVQTAAFSDLYLENGQNTLMAVTEYGGDIWLPIWFGVPRNLIYVLDRGAAKTNADTMRLSGAPSPTVLAAAISTWAKYNETVGTTRTWSGIIPPSSGAALDIYEQDVEGWQEACRVGQRTYEALDKGLSPSVWAGMYRVLRDAHPDKVASFFDEVHDGSGQPRSATRQLRDWFMRRPITVTRSGDRREPAELVVRAFNAWLRGKSYSAVSQQGFVLSRVRP